MSKATAKKKKAENPLIKAIRNGDVKKVEAFLAKDVSVNGFVTSVKKSLLSIAVFYNQIPIIELLLSKGAKVNGAFPKEELPLIQAADVTVAAAAALMLASADPFKKGKEGINALEAAMEKERADIAEVLWSKSKDKLDREFFDAVLNNDFFAVQFLLKSGANVNKAGDNNITPLMLSAGEGRETMTKLLLASHADISIKSDFGFDALYYAEIDGHSDMVKLLTEKQKENDLLKKLKSSKPMVKNNVKKKPGFFGTIGNLFRK